MRTLISIDIENPKKELIDNKGETIIYIIKVMGMSLLGRSLIAQ